MPPRWLAALLTGMLLLLVGLVSGRLRRTALFAFAFSLQIGLVLYLTDPPPPAPVGASWPDALALPLPFLTGLAAMVIRARRRLMWDRPITVCWGLLFLTTAISIPGSPAVAVGIFHLVLLASYFCVFVAAANVIESDEDVAFVIRILLWSLVLQALIYFLQTLAGATFTPWGDWIENEPGAMGRYGGTAGTHASTLASFLLPVLLLATAQFLTERSSDRQWSLAVGVTAGSAALIATLTRASWTGFALGLAYLLGAGIRRRLIRPRRAILAVVLIGAAGIVLLPRVVVRLNDDHAGAFEERKTLAEMACSVIKAKPLTGVGAGAYPEVFESYLTPALAMRWLYVVHNVYLLRAAETGLPGLAAWVAVLCVAFCRAAPERVQHPGFRAVALGWRAGIIALSWEMLWDISLGPAAMSLFWFLSGLMVALAKPGHGIKESRKER